MNAEKYFDHAATTPVDPQVLAAMLPFFAGSFGNANSIHAAGREAFAAVETARQQVATAIGAESPEQIVFTSGATEACNWVISHFADGAIGPFEHSAVRESALARGFSIIRNDGFRLLPNQDHRKSGSLAAQMMVNNETGMVWNATAELSTWGEHLLMDGTQALGKCQFDLEGIDFATFSAHKLYGPKGVGALYVREGYLSPFLFGGEQESGQRGGTLNVPGIVGFGAGCEQVSSGDHPVDALRLRQAVLEELQFVSDWRINEGPFRHQVPHILSLSFLGVQGETLVIEADQAGFAISSGAACSSRSTEPSHVLVALGLEPEWIHGTIRISFGRSNTAESSAELGRVLATIVNKLRNLSN